MTFAIKTTFAAAALALTVSVSLALPAAAQSYTTANSPRAHRIAEHHAMIRQHAYRVGYAEGFRDGHFAAATGAVPPDLQTGRSAYVGPNIGNASATPTADGDAFGGNGILGTGVLDGQGALGLGVLGF